MKNSITLFLAVFTLFLSCNSLKKDVTVIDTDKNLKLENGVLLYQDEEFTGTIKSFYDYFILKSEVLYLKGKKHGVENIFYLSGEKLSERYYLNGFKVGVHKGWWNNGSLKFEYHFNQEGEYDGTVKEWYESGQLLRSFNYENGEEFGSQRLWNPDGSIKANYIVENGDRFGLIGLKKCYTVNTNTNEIE
jgi:antitoxin component YwqK of YwqJK toxin-antitoxin module